MAMLRAPGDRARIWMAFRLHTEWILLIWVAGWWGLWVAFRGSIELAQLADCLIGRQSPGVSLAALFWLPFAFGLGAFVELYYASDCKLLNLRWGTLITLRQAGWKLVNAAIPLVLIGFGFDELLAGNPLGGLWILVAGAVNRAGIVFLRKSLGFAMHDTKSGEMRNRALAMARKMGVTLSRIYLVPAGKGHLTNAYSTAGAIALTDNLGKYLSKLQIDSVIAHELAHLKLHHTRKHLLAVIVYFVVEMGLAFHFRQGAEVYRPWVDVALLLAPILALYSLSRRFEYAADRAALEFTGDPESAIRALGNLHVVSAVPLDWNGLTGLFQTHPAFSSRAKAMAEAGQLPTERLAQLMKTAGAAPTAEKASPRCLDLQAALS